MEEFAAFINEYTGTDFGMYLVLAGLLVLLLLYSGYRRWLSGSGQRKIVQTLKKAGKDILSDIILPDGMGSHIHIDYLLLTPYGIIVVDLKDYSGLIYGGEKIDQWAQLVGRKSYTFENPLRHNQSRVAAVKSLIPGVSVISWVVFSDAGEFPKGRPDNVYMLKTLLADVGKVTRKDDIPVLTSLGWKKIMDFVEEYNKSSRVG